MPAALWLQSCDGPLQLGQTWLMSRSGILQVFRALQTEREAEACSTLLACLHKCLQPHAQKSSFHDSIEICLTLQVCQTTLGDMPGHANTLLYTHVMHAPLH